MNDSKSWRDYINYFVAFGIGVIFPIILSFIGSVAGLAIVLPTTIAGWIVWSASILSTGGANMAIYHALQQQAKINVKNDPHFKTANEMLCQVKSKTVQARSPKEYFRQQYGLKAVSLFITSSLAAFSLGQAILVFNLITFISHFITMMSGIIFAYYQMKTTECFWTDEYYIYAQQEVERQKKQKQNNVSESFTMNERKEQATNDNNQQ